MNAKLKNYQYYLIILVIALITSIPLLWKDLDVYHDDGIQHIGRGYSTYLSLQNGENTEVLSNLSNGFGYSWNLFYGPLSTLIILICTFFTSTLIIAYKLTLFLGLLLSRDYYVSFCK